MARLDMERDGKTVLVLATDGANWYVGGEFDIRYRRFKKSTGEVTIDRKLYVEFAGGARIHLNQDGVHFSKITKIEAIAILEAFGGFSEEQARQIAESIES